MGRIFGTIQMQKWGIRLIPEEQRLDVTRYPEEFNELPGFMARTEERKPDPNAGVQPVQ